MALTRYEAVVTKLYRQNVFNPVKLGLANTHALYALLNRPVDRIPAVHIAGTNGKGSVALKMAKGLEYGGVRTGLFVSPHVSSFRERMQINSTMISEEQIVEQLPYIFELCEANAIPATFFEVTTALAFRFFDSERCEASLFIGYARHDYATQVVLEAGLGGRLDATNVIKPSLCIITSVGLDHTRILGDTVEIIAREKAGIMKPNIPRLVRNCVFISSTEYVANSFEDQVLVGPDVPLDVLRECAQAAGSPLYTIGDVLESHQTSVDVELMNQQLALAGLTLLKHSCAALRNHITDGAVRKGLVECPPCRFETLHVTVWSTKLQKEVRVDVILDMGHNPPALAAFAAKVRVHAKGRGVRVVAGFSRDKDLSSCVYILRQLTPEHNIHFVQAAHPRATPVDILYQILETGSYSGTYDEVETGNIANTMRLVLQECANRGELLCVCGTVFIMAEARAALGFVEPRDSDVLIKSAGIHLKDAQEYFLDVNMSSSTAV